MKSGILIFALSLLSLLFFGCKQWKMEYPNDVTIVVPETSEGAFSPRSVIFHAGTRLGWEMKELEPGLISATLEKRNHRVEARIRYSEKQIGIFYDGSENMDYNPTTRKLNPAYNRWVRNLEKAIRQELSAAAFKE